MWGAQKIRGREKIPLKSVTNEKWVGETNTNYHLGAMMTRVSEEVGKSISTCVKLQLGSHEVYPINQSWIWIKPPL